MSQLQLISWTRSMVWFPKNGCGCSFQLRSGPRRMLIGQRSLPPPHSSPHWLCWSFELVQLLPFWGTCLLTLDACQSVAMFFHVYNYFLCVWKRYMFVSETYFGRNPLSLWLYSFAYSLNADGWAYRRVPWSDRALLSKQMSLLSGHWWYRGWAYCIYLTNWALMLQTSSEFWLWKKRPSIIWCFGEENPRPAQLNVWFCWYSISVCLWIAIFARGFLVKSAKGYAQFSVSCPPCRQSHEKQSICKLMRIGWLARIQTIPKPTQRLTFDRMT